MAITHSIRPDFRMLLMTGGLIMLVTVVGCYDPTSNSVDAGAGKAKAETQVVAESSDLEFALTGDNCDIKWTGSNSAGLSPYGYFYDLTGKVIVDGKTGTLKHFEVLIDMQGVKAMNESLTEKLKNNGFFQVDEFPQSRFVSTTIQNEAREGDPEGTSDVVEGNFQLRDVTKSIQFPVEFKHENGKISLVSEFKIDRKDYGVVYSNSVEDALIRDDVLINIDVDAEAK